jgi:hypothetical protein
MVRRLLVGAAAVAPAAALAFGAVPASASAAASVAVRPSHTVRVPAVTDGKTLLDAYAALHRAGLHVRLPAVTLSDLCGTGVAAQSPQPGVRVKRGAIVTLSDVRCFLGSPAVAVDPPPPVTVPDVAGWSVAGALRWAQGADEHWSVALPALRDGTAARLLDDYVVTGQSPGPGAALSPGTASGAAYTVTPLALHARAR